MSCIGRMEYEHLDNDVVIKTIDEAILLGAKTICFSGGEPFLYCHFENILKYLSKPEYNNVNIVIYTSGNWGARRAR